MRILDFNDFFFFVADFAYENPHGKSIWILQFKSDCTARISCIINGIVVRGFPVNHDDLTITFPRGSSIETRRAKCVAKVENGVRVYARQTHGEIFFP